MKGEIRVYTNLAGRWDIWKDDDVDLINVSRTVMTERMEIKYIFKSIDYDKICTLTNFVASRRNRIMEFYINDKMMHRFNATPGDVIIQEFHRDEECTVEVSFFVEVDEIC